MAIDNTALLDLIATTLADLPKGEFEVMWDSQRFEINNVLKQNARQIDGGTSIVRNVVLDETGNAKYRRLYDVDLPSVENVQKQITVPWCQLSTDYSWDVLELKRNQSTAKGFINLLKSRRTERLWGFAELIERRGWLTPTNASDTLFPNGIPYYLNVADNGVTTDGFQGKTIRYTDGSTGTLCAGLDGSVEAKWRNYAGVYTKVDNGLLRKMRTAAMLTQFNPPAFIQSPGSDAEGPVKRLYAGDRVCTELMDLADKRDDANTPKDLVGKVLVNQDGGVYFNRMPLVFVPQLSSASFSPIYAVDWSKMQALVQEGYWMEESKPMTDRAQHTTITVYLDGCHQFLCTNRRSVGFVMHLVTS